MKFATLLVLVMISRKLCLSALVWLHYPANSDSFCTNPEILGEKSAKTGWVGGWGVGGWEIRLLAVLPSVFSSQMQALSQGLWVLCAEMGGLAYPRCRRGFRAVALCLAKVEPFYWPSDSSSTVIGPVK